MVHLNDKEISCESDYLTALECLDLREAGYPQGKSEYLWHKDKHNRDEWELYRRNPYDQSRDGDKMGYNRWVSAVTVEMAQAWQDSKPKPPPERNVVFLTFQRDNCPNPRQSACIFATSIRNDLISINESRIDGGLQVCVYFWKECE